MTFKKKLAIHQGDWGFAKARRCTDWIKKIRTEHIEKFGDAELDDLEREEPQSKKANTEGMELEKTDARSAQTHCLGRFMYYVCYDILPN